MVDDDHDAQEIFCALLDHYGARVACASSADDAVAKVATGYTYHVLVSDLAMPERDGFWLVRELKRRAAEDGRRVLAIAVSGSATPQVRASAAEAGFDVFLLKPVDADVLIEAVARYRS